MPKFITVHDAVNKAVEIRVDADAIQYYKDTGAVPATPEDPWKPAFATTLVFYGGNALPVSETPDEVDTLIDEVCEKYR